MAQPVEQAADKLPETAETRLVTYRWSYSPARALHQASVFWLTSLCPSSTSTASRGLSSPCLRDGLCCFSTCPAGNAQLTKMYERICGSSLCPSCCLQWQMLRGDNTKGALRVIFRQAVLATSCLEREQSAYPVLTAASRFILLEFVQFFFILSVYLAPVSSSGNQFHSNNIFWQQCGMLPLLFLTPSLAICFCAT